MEQAQQQTASLGWHDFWHYRQPSLQHLLAELEVTMEEIFALPQNREPDSVAYCSLCLAQYRAGFEYCKDCDVVLNDFSF